MNRRKYSFAILKTANINSTSIKKRVESKSQMYSCKLNLFMQCRLCNKFTVNSLRRTKCLNTEILDINIFTVHFGRITIAAPRYVFLSCRNKRRTALLNSRWLKKNLFISRHTDLDFIWSIQEQIISFGWGKKEVVWICWLLCKKISDSNLTKNIKLIICFVINYRLISHK